MTPEQMESEIIAAKENILQLKSSIQLLEHSINDVLTFAKNIIPKHQELINIQNKVSELTETIENNRKILKEEIENVKSDIQPSIDTAKG